MTITIYSPIPTSCITRSVKVLLVKSSSIVDDVTNALRDTKGRYVPYPEPVYTGWSSVHWNATG